MAISVDKLVRANSEDAITNAITGIHRRSNTLQMDVHLVLCAIAKRWNQTGDIRPAIKHVNHLLQNGQLGGVRTNAIKAWVQEFFGFQLVEAGEAKGTFCKGTIKAPDLAAIADNRWWEFKPEPEYKPMDFDKMLMALLDKGEKRAATATAEDKVDPALIAAIKAARTNYLGNAH